MKEKILSEEGHRQQMKLKELQTVAEHLGCTLPQLAIGKRRPRFSFFLIEYHAHQFQVGCYLLFPLCYNSSAWCLRNEGVNSVLLGASSTEQIMENIKAIQVRMEAVIWMTLNTKSYQTM